MYTNILVPVAFDEDHSPDQALAAARALVSPGGRVTLLHVMPEVPTYAISYMPEGYADELRRALQEEMAKLVAGFADGHTAIIEGNAASQILDWSEANGNDCIIIASHRPGLQDYLLGSTAARVVRHAGCSVLVLR